MLLGGLAEIQENTEDLFDHVWILCYIVTLFTLTSILHVACRRPSLTLPGLCCVSKEYSDHGDPARAGVGGQH